MSETNRSKDDIHAGEQLCTYGVGFSRRKKGYLVQVSAPEKSEEGFMCRGGPVWGVSAQERRGRHLCREVG